MFPKTDMSRGWGRHGTQGGRMASFYKRYYHPLKRYGRYKFGLTDNQADEYVARYMARECEREVNEAAVFRLFDADKGRFRSLLATSFWRFCRDELRKDQRQQSFEPLDDIDEADGADFEFCRLVARDFFNHMRQGLLKTLTDAKEQQVLALKWPEDIDHEPAKNASIERQLGLTRAQVRTIQQRIAQQFLYLLRRQLHRAGLSKDCAQALLGDTCRVLDQEQAMSEAP